MNLLKIGLAQITRIWFNCEKTLEKVFDFVNDAAAQNCELVNCSQINDCNAEFSVVHKNFNFTTKSNLSTDGHR